MASIAISSPFHFNRIFRQVAGIPPFRFLSALRMEAAKDLLLHTDEAIIDVCFDVGYESLGSFTTRFTEMVGLPPSRLRTLSKAEPQEAALPASASREPPAAASGRLVGRVLAAEQFRGLIFVGLFSTPLPSGPPASCTLLERPGKFTVRLPFQGDYFLSVVAFPLSAGLSLFSSSSDMLLVGRREKPITVKHPMKLDEIKVALRPPRPVDPPILVALPFLLAREGRGRFPLGVAGGRMARKELGK